MVDRCVCHNVLFADLIDLARRENLSPAGLSARTQFGTGCGLCVPYVILALRIGKSELPVLSPDQCIQLRSEMSDICTFKSDAKCECKNHPHKAG